MLALSHDGFAPTHEESLPLALSHEGFTLTQKEGGPEALPRLYPDAGRAPSRSQAKRGSTRNFTNANRYKRAQCQSRNISCILPRRCDPFFSIPYTLFLIPNFPQLYCFVRAAHSLAKTPGGGVH